MIDERKNVQTPLTRTYCKRSKPLPYYNSSKKDAPALKIYPASSYHSTTPFSWAIEKKTKKKKEGREHWSYDMPKHNMFLV